MTTTHPRLSAQCRINTPLGPLTAAATPQGLAGLWFDAQAHHPGALDVPIQPQHPALAAAAQWLARYFAGQAQVPSVSEDTADTLPAVPLDLHGTPFQQAVWRALLALPQGSTSTYSQIATAAGAPAAVRAAGAAIGRNPVSILVPCHRVLGRDGSLTGYAGGLQRKQALLLLEGVLRAAPARP